MTNPNTFRNPSAPSLPVSALLPLAFWIFPLGAFSAPPGFDLLRTGQPDSDMAVVPCGAARCLQVISRTLDPPINLLLPIETGALASAVEHIETIGPHTNRKLSNVAVYFIDRDQRPSMVVFDLETATQIGLAKAPLSITSAYFDFARGPQQKSYPFMAPPFETSHGTWGYMCIFKSDGPVSSRCGTGFREMDIAPPGSGGNYHREVGGYTWNPGGYPFDFEQISLIYLGYIHTISSNPGILDPVNTLNINHCRQFRNYGIHTAVTSPEGSPRATMLGGNPVSLFSDADVNVERFVSVLEAPRGQPSQRRLAWNECLSFHSNIFAPGDCTWERYLSDTVTVSNYPGDFSNNALFRFSDGRIKVGGVPVILVNYFKQSPGGGVSQCVREQCGWELDRDHLGQQWYDCAASNLGSRGDWAVRAYRESDGRHLLDTVQDFVWGWSDKVYPGGETVYFVQHTPPGASTLDFRNIREPTLQVRTLRMNDDGSLQWVEFGNLPAIGVPAITPLSEEGGPPTSGPRGVGSYTSYSELVSKPVDASGLEAIKFRDRASNVDYRIIGWVGWNTVTSSWEIKEDRARTLTVDLAGPGSELSSISAVPAGLTCKNRRCRGSFIDGAQVTLGGQAASGYRFVNFTGDSVCGSGTFTMGQNDVYCIAIYDFPLASTVNLDCSGGIQAFGYAGPNDQSFTLPSSCPAAVSVTAKLWGAGGAANGCGVYSYSAPCASGGGGGFATGTFTVNPGDTFTVVAGQGGVHFDSVRTYGGGGPGGRAGGGGRSAIRTGPPPGDLEIITAGAGGGAGFGPGHGAGSAFTGTVYQPGAPFLGGSAVGSSGGGGGGSGRVGGPASISTGPGGGGGTNDVSSPLLTNASAMAGSNYFPANNLDPDYVSGVGLGGSIRSNGGNGRVVIRWGPPISPDLALDCSGGSQAFPYTGGYQSFTLPSSCPGPVSVTAKLWGAGGASNGAGFPSGAPSVLPVALSSGGGGGFAIGTFIVNPGQTYTVITGRGGVYFSSVPAFGGGGPGGNGGGGGRSAIRAGSPPGDVEFMTAGGGGGAGDGPGHAAGAIFTGTVYHPGAPFLGGSAEGSIGGGGGGGGQPGGPSSTNTGPGGGGGLSYVDSSRLADASTLPGLGSNPARTDDSDYAGGVAVGATGEHHGGNGLVTITWESATAVRGPQNGS